MALSPSKKFEQLNGVIFTASTKKVTQHHIYHYFVYVKDVPCHVELCSFVGYEKHLRSLLDDKCSRSWHLGSFVPVRIFRH
jgi:hypothetical protein